jgi:hypothetical protein
MGTPLYMDISDACTLVTEYAETHTGGDILAGLREMRASWDDLDKEDRVAYTMFMDAGRKLFAEQQQ